ncbi:hypothetical protein Goklo_024853, partial [Gossypium klotzschianum]|nr:hypothetical protein [Gossypium klotzschianum]
NEVKEHLTKTIDKCYNDFNYYQTQAGIDLISIAQDLLHQNIYQLWTDGRRMRHIILETSRKTEMKNLCEY